MSRQPAELQHRQLHGGIFTGSPARFIGLDFVNHPNNKGARFP
jgi:hypothetical protein